MPTTLNSGLQLPDKGSVDWYGSMQTNYNLLDNHLENTDIHVTAEDKANWDSKQGSLSQAQLDAIAQVATNTSDIATLQSGKANASHTHSSSDITDIGDYATKQYVDNSINGLVDNAPAALDTLKELSTALNDDANFASTVATALSAKANSADLATVATSGSYNDLSNKPSIPTNTSDLNNDSGFVTLNDFDIPAKTSDLTNDSGFITSSDVPTGTSDLINDSNFVDTSNPAVSSGITSAKVSDYDTHIADTDIHVTTADKNKWNNGVSQAFVFRYSSTALVASSTNSNTLLDNTDNLKVGDKVIDSSGVLFSITAIDTVNSTFSIGTALIDLAQDSDVVHKSGGETVNGKKTFSDDLTIYNYDSSQSTKNLNISSSKIQVGDTSNSDAFGIRFNAGASYVAQILAAKDTIGTQNLQLSLRTKDGSDNFITSMVRSRLSANGNSSFEPGTNDSISLGSSVFKWKSVYATNYYYGSNNVEFSTKFVTTDTAQTVSGSKTFSSNINVYNSDSTANTPNLYLRSSKIEISSQGNTSGDQNLTYLDKNGTTYAYVKGAVQSNGSVVKIRTIAKDSSDNSVINELQMLAYTNGNKAVFPSYSNEVDLGISNYKWKSFNGLEPSSLSLPSGNVSDVIDISSYITDLSGGINEYTAPANGWITVTCLGCTGIKFSISNFMANGSYRENPNQISSMIPICKNQKVGIYIYGSSPTIQAARFIPCQGNV